MKPNLFIFLLTTLCMSANFYIRADGTATKVNAVGPSTDYTACMTLATHNAASFNAGDTVFCVYDGGINRGVFTPKNGVIYRCYGGFYSNSHRA